MPKKKKRSTQDTAYDESLLSKMKKLEDKEPAPRPERSKMQQMWRAKELREKREAEAALNPKIPKKKSKFLKKMVAPSADDVHRMAQAHAQIVSAFENILEDNNSGTGYGILQDTASDEYQEDLRQLSDLLDSHLLSTQDKDTVRLILSVLSPPTGRGYGDALFALSPHVLEGLTKHKLTKVAKTVGIYRPDNFSADELEDILKACLNPDLRSLLLLRQFTEYYLRQQSTADEDDEEEDSMDPEQIAQPHRSDRAMQFTHSLERCWETFETISNVINAIRFKKLVEKKEQDENKELTTAKFQEARMSSETRAEMKDLFGDDSSEDGSDVGGDSDSDASFGEESMIPPEASEPLPGIGSDRERSCGSRYALKAELEQVKSEIERIGKSMASKDPNSREKEILRLQYVELIHQRRELLRRLQGCREDEIQAFKVGQEVLYLPLNEIAMIVGFSRAEGCVPPYIVRTVAGDEERAWSGDLRPRDGAEISSSVQKRKTKSWNPDDAREGIPESEEDSMHEDEHLPTLKFYDETQGTVIDVAPRTSAFYDQDNVPADCIAMYKSPPWIKQSIRAMYVRFVDPESFNQTSEFLNPSPVNLVDTALNNNVRVPAKIVGLVTNSALNGRDATLIGLEGDNAYKVEITQQQAKRVVRLAKNNVEVPDIYKGNWYRPTKLYYALQCYRLKDKKQNGFIFSGSIDQEPVGSDSDSTNTTRLSMEICYRSATQIIFQDEDIWNAERREHDRKRQTSVAKLERLLQQPINEASIAFSVNTLSRILSEATGTDIYSVDSSGDPLKLKDGDHSRSYVRIAVDCMVAICRQSTDTIKCLPNQLARISAYINLDKRDPNEDRVFIKRLRQESYAPEVLCTLSDEEMAPTIFLGPNTDSNAVEIFNRHLAEELQTQENHFSVRFYKNVNPNDQMIKEKDGEMWSTIPHLVSLAPWIDHQCELKEAGVDPSKIVYYKPSDGSGPECFKIDDIIQNQVSGDTRPPEFTEFLDNVKRIYGPFEKFRTMKPREDKPVFQGNKAQKNAVLALFQMVGLESWRANDLPPVPQLLSEWERNYEGMWSMLTAKFGSDLAIPPKIPSAIIAPGLFRKMRERLAACIARSQAVVIPEPHGHENWIEARAKWGETDRNDEAKDTAEQPEANERPVRETASYDAEEPMIADSDDTDTTSDPLPTPAATQSPRLDCVKCGKSCSNKRITFPYMENGSVSMLHFCGRDCAERTTHFD